MKSGLKPATKAEKRRFEILKREIGCVACRVLFGYYRPAHAHHLLSGGRRRGHSETIPLCDDHHVGNKLSTHRTKLLFSETVGTDDELLAETNRRVADFEGNTIRGAT